MTHQGDLPSSIQDGLIRTKDLAFLSATLMRGHPLTKLATLLTLHSKDSKCSAE